MNYKSLPLLDDATIIDMIINKSTMDAGFKALMLKYQEKIYWHIRRIVHHHEDANDVIQNTFIKVYRNIHNYKRESLLYTWLYRIATNESLSYLKNKRKKGTYEEIDSELTAQHLTADEYFDGDKAEESLILALDKLPEKQKIVFNLRYFDDMNYSDMSEILDTSVGALKASYHHAVKKIEKYLKNTLG